MRRLLCITAFACGLFAATISQSTAEAQTLTIGRGGVRYNGYGRGYYGGYGRGYNNHYRGYYRGNNGYSGYGHGPYGYGAGPHFQNRFYRPYGYGRTIYYTGNGYPGYYGPTYVPLYSPLGFGGYNVYGW